MKQNLNPHERWSLQEGGTVRQWRENRKVRPVSCKLRVRLKQSYDSLNLCVANVRGMSRWLVWGGYIWRPCGIWPFTLNSLRTFGSSARIFTFICNGVRGFAVPAALVKMNEYESWYWMLWGSRSVFACMHKWLWQILSLSFHSCPSIYFVFVPHPLPSSSLSYQPDIIQKRGQLLWENSKEATSGSGATHVILLQKPSIAPGLPATIQIHKTQTRKTNTGRKINGTYLPILNSYPRIAPHPSKKPPDKTSSSEDSQNLSKRVCTEHKSDNSLITSSLLEQQLSKQPESAVLTPGLPGPCSHSSSESHSSSSPTIISSSLRSPSVSKLYTSSFLATRGPHRNSSSSARHCRFLNTVEILRQSGLLDITLRTQELLRQSNATQRDIVQLRQHTQLLCQAASNPNGSLDGNTAWKNLHQAMRESGNYPSLKILQNEQFPFHPDSTSHPESGAVSESNRPTVSENSDVPPSPLPNPMPDSSQRFLPRQQPHAQQGRECKASGKPSEKVIIMPPDSSTGDDIL